MFVFHFYIYVIIIRFIEQGICICVIRINLLLLFFMIKSSINYIHLLIYSFIHCIFHAKPENLYKCVHSSSNAILI